MTDIIWGNGEKIISTDSFQIVNFASRVENRKLLPNTFTSKSFTFNVTREMNKTVGTRFKEVMLTYKISDLNQELHFLIDRGDVVH